MDGILRKPYEISIWEDNIIESEGQTHIEEKKLMIIGSDTMDAPNKVFEPVLKKNINGEVSLTFSLQYKYFDPVSEKIIINPFSSFLINERKIKLYYDDEWYEFIVKNHTESSDGMKWTYDCVDAFVLELSKTGYNLEFSPEINNNQGTVTELAEAVLKDTDWSVGLCNIGRQTVEEPIYYAVLTNTQNITIKNLDDPESGNVPGAGTRIYVFYSYIVNKNGKFVQFILQSDNQEIDDKGNYIATNYRILDDLVYDETNNQFKDKNGTAIISILNLETQHHSYRLVYNQRTTYDPIMQRTVDIFKVADTDEAYRYTDYQYSTSDIVMSYVTNGDKFDVLNGNAPQGWDGIGAFTSSLVPAKMEVITDPKLDKDVNFKTFVKYLGVEAFLSVKFFEALNNTTYHGAIFNSGINDNASMINSISKGQKYMFRWRGGEFIVPPNQQSNTNNSNEKVDLNKLKPFGVNEIGCIVAKYTKISQEDGQHQAYFTNQIDKDGIILQFEFNGDTQQHDTYTANNIIDSGYFVKEEDKIVRYMIDGVSIEPSNNYVYCGPIKTNVNNQLETTAEVSDPPTYYVWDKNNSVFINKNDTYYLDYNYIVAPALQSVTKTQLEDPNVDIGIFIYLRDNNNVNKYYNFADVQLTQYIEDANGKPVLIGNVPTAASAETNYYYMKPAEHATTEDIETYTSLESFSAGIGIPISEIKPEYNEGSEKVLSITESKSNCFNILQSIAETFEAWLKINVAHNQDGSITTDEHTGKPIKTISFYEFAGNDNLAGFKYGINLQSIERTVESDEIVTKLIVDSAQSEYTDEGIVSIQLGDANPSGESYILNFDYFYNKGLITDVAACKEDISTFNREVKDLNNQIQELEKQYRQLSMSLTKINSNRTVYHELVNEAKDDLNKAKEDFKKATGRDYEAYEQSEVSLGKIYVKASIVMPQYKSDVQYYKLEGGNYVQVANPTPEEFELDLYYVVLEDIDSQDAIFDILGRIYTDSSVINNYTGLYTNSNVEYKEIRKQLYGTPQYSFTATVVEDVAHQHTLKIYLNDYIDLFKFAVNDIEQDPATPNKKTWDVPLNVFPSAHFKLKEIISDYTVYDATGKSIAIDEDVEIDDAKVHKFIIKPNNAESGITEQIKELQNSKNEKTTEFFNKYSRFIQEGNWNSTDYIDSNLYYLDALQVSNNSAYPKVSYSISVVEISEIEGFEHYNFDVGDKTYIEDEEFFGWNSEKNAPAREEVIVSEVEWHLDEPDNNSITVQNFKTQFEDLFQRLTATVQTVQYNEAAYAKTSTIVDADGSLNQDLLVAALDKARGRQFALTSDGSVYIDGDAIYIQNLTNAANRVIINSEGIQISDNGGISYATAISGRGINIGEVFAGSINTDKITIGGDENPSFRWDTMGLSAYSKDNDGVYDLKSYVRYDQYGLYGIKNGEDFKPSSLDDVKNSAHFAVTWDGFFIKNSYTGGGRVEITSGNDFRVLNTVNDQENEKIKIGALEWIDDNDQIVTEPLADRAPSKYGIRVRNNLGDTVIETNDDGNVIITGIIDAFGGNFTDLVTVGKFNGYQVVTLVPEDNPYEQGWYELVSGNYVLTQDEAVDVTKNYYEKIDNEYVLVTPLHNDPYHSGWYRYDEETQQYVQCTEQETSAAPGVTYYSYGYNGKPYIEIDGQNSIIQTSNYQDGAGGGWKIESNGNAVFNNITARGAIKTAVFEYSEIQAVGGAFLFRPSSTIRSARPSSETSNALVVTVEQPSQFSIGDYVKVSNVNADVSDVLRNNGLVHVYKISDLRTIDTNVVYIPCDEDEQTVVAEINYYKKIGDLYIEVSAEEKSQEGANPYENGWYRRIADTEVELKLADGLNITTDVGLDELIGGALISLGYDAMDERYHDGAENYGIGINSSDNFVSLPARAISLFESVIDLHAQPTDSKVNYKYYGILGTLPDLSKDDVDKETYQYLKNTQGIYTNNLYIGDKNQYIAFYSENKDDNKKLVIKATEIIHDVIEPSYIQCDSSQTTVDLNKTYYSHYIPINNVESTDNPLENQWYYFDNSIGVNDYRLCEEQEPILSRTYYANVGSEYGEIVDPDLQANPYLLQWFTTEGEYQKVTLESYLLDERLKYIWQNNERQPAQGARPDYNTGVYMASGNELPFDRIDARTYGFNSFIDNISLNLRYNEYNLLRLSSSEGLVINTFKDNIVKPRISLNAENGLQFFDSQESSIATYNDNGVIIGNQAEEQRFVRITSDGMSVCEGSNANSVVTFGDGISFNSRKNFVIGNEESYIRYIPTLKYRKCIETESTVDPQAVYYSHYIEVTNIKPDDSPFENGWYYFNYDNYEACTEEQVVSGRIYYNNISPDYGIVTNIRSGDNPYLLQWFVIQESGRIEIKAGNFEVGDQTFDAVVQQTTGIANDALTATQQFNNELQDINSRISSLINENGDSFTGSGGILLDTGATPSILINKSNSGNRLTLTQNSIVFNNGETVNVIIDTSKVATPQVETTRITMKSTTQQGGLFWIMRSNGHLSLKKL